jgi:hypothetical protein
MLPVSLLCGGSLPRHSRMLRQPCMRIFKRPFPPLDRLRQLQLIRGTPDRCSAIKQARGVLASHQNLTPAANSSSRTCRCTLLATPRRLFNSMKTFAPPQMMSQSGKTVRVPRCFASNPEIAFRGVFSNAVANTPAARWRLNSSATRVRARHSSWRETLRRTTAKVSAATFAGA